MDKQASESLARDLMPAAPPVGVAGMTLLGFPVADWVLLATLIYTIAQLVVVMPKAIDVVRKWTRRK